MDFLDLTDATDTEKRRLQDLLYNNKCAAVQVSCQSLPSPVRSDPLVLLIPYTNSCHSMSH